MSQLLGRSAAIAVLVVASLGASACVQAPVITQKQVDAKKTPAKHPQLNETQKKDCTLCHKVVATKSK